jgi:hypothetical protein
VSIAIRCALVSHLRYAAKMSSVMNGSLFSPGAAPIVAVLARHASDYRLRTIIRFTSSPYALPRDDSIEQRLPRRVGQIPSNPSVPWRAGHSDGTRPPRHSGWLLVASALQERGIDF